MAELQDTQIREIRETVNRFDAKLDKFAEMFVRKDSYSNDTQRLALDIKQNALDIREVATSGAREHGKIREEYEASVKALKQDWDELKDLLAKNQVRARDFVITTFVSFLIGGGAMGVISFFVLHH